MHFNNCKIYANFKNGAEEPLFYCIVKYGSYRVVPFEAFLQVCKNALQVFFALLQYLIVILEKDPKILTELLGRY